MATKLGLWNRALNKIAELKISGLGEDSVNKRLLESNYDDDRRALLEMHSWRFARKLEVLQLATAPPFGYDNAFQLPNDFIRIVYFNNIDPEYRETKLFEINGQEIHTDQDSAKITYIRDLDSPGLFTGGFTDALATYMANNICYNRTKDQGLMDRMDTRFEKALSRAKRADANGSNTPPPALSAYPNLGARLGINRWPANTQVNG